MLNSLFGIPYFSPVSTFAQAVLFFCSFHMHPFDLCFDFQENQPFCY